MSNAEPAGGEKEWKAWVAERDNKIRTNPKTYLNVNDAAYLAKDQTVYLPLDAKSADAFKFSYSPEKGAAKIQFDGKQAMIDRPGMKPYDLLKDHTWAINPEILLEAQLTDGPILRVFIHYLKHPKVVNFKGLKFWPYNPAMVAHGTFKRKNPPEPVTFATERHLKKDMSIVGQFEFKIGGQKESLNLYADNADPKKIEYMTVWFRDGSSGHGSYGASRDMEPGWKELPADGEKVVMDFNRLTNPYCARSPYYNCLITRDPALKSAITAGEADPGEHL